MEHDTAQHYKTYCVRNFINNFFWTSHVISLSSDYDAFQISSGS